MKIKEKYYRRKAKRDLIKKYSYLQEVDKLLEEYLTAQILKGGSQEFLSKSRQSLVKKQGDMKNQEGMIVFLKNAR